MKKTTYYGLLKPEGTDAVDIQNFNDNADAIDQALHEAADASGDLSKGKVYASIAAARVQLSSGDTLGNIIGSIMKWFADLKTAAFKDVANNDSTTADGYVADARIVKTHGDEIDKHTTQLGGLYLGQTSTGKWGYKTSANGSVTPFREPVGTATAGDVLTGKTFANASSDSLTGTMANYGSMTATLTPSGNNTATKTYAAGYYSGGTVTANGKTAYTAGYNAGKTAFITYNLGQVTSANIAGLFSNYKAMSASNFAIAVKSIYAESERIVHNGGTYSCTVYPTISYNASTGTVTLSNINNVPPTGDVDSQVTKLNVASYNLLVFASIQST